MVIILMGVSGSGKTTIGKALSKKINLPFYDADDFHSEKNIDKMKNNIPLTDKDRLPWLDILALNIEKWEQVGGAILACSALKESYRKILSSKVESIFWVVLSGSFDLINQRLKNRSNHYMKTSLLKSQFDALEIPNYGLHINNIEDTDTIINIIIIKSKDYD